MKLREKILLASAVIFSAVILFPVIRHYQLKAAVNHYRAELKAKGDWVELAEVLLPPLPEGKNAAHLFSNAISALNTNRGVLWSNQPPVMRMVTFGRAMIGWQQPFIRNYLPNQTSNSWDEIDAALVSEGSGLSLLRQLPSEPVFDFRLNYDGGFRR